jgi:hypothetical protein
MDKLTLDLEALAVESFAANETLDEPEWTTTACCAANP